MIIERLYPLAASDERIDALWLFGSYASGIVHPMSDVDIGVLPAAPLSFHDELLLGAHLSEPLPIAKTDVVLVDDPRLPAALRQSILNGILIFERNPAHVAAVSQKATDVCRSEAVYRKRIQQLVVKYWNGQVSSVDPEVITRKVQVMNENIADLELLRMVPRDEFLAQFYYFKSAQHCLQVAIEAGMDALSHIIVANRWKLPENNHQVVLMAVKHNVIAPERAATYQAMNRFRNLIVHQYADVDIQLVYEFVQNNIDDLIALRSEIESYSKGTATGTTSE